jgi:hypothetical protein
MFQDAFNREQFEMDYMYDWIIRRQTLKQRMLQAQNEGPTKPAFDQSAHKTYQQSRMEVAPQKHLNSAQKKQTT